MKDLRIAVSLLTLGLLTLSVVPWEATAATMITTFGVSATVEAMCLMSATSAMSKTSRAEAAEEVSTITVTCTNSTPYTVGFDSNEENKVPAPLKPDQRRRPEIPVDDPGSPFYWPGESDETSRPKGNKGLGTGASQAYKFSHPCTSNQPSNSVPSCETITATVTY